MRTWTWSTQMQRLSPSDSIHPWEHCRRWTIRCERSSESGVRHGYYLNPNDPAIRLFHTDHLKCTVTSNRSLAIDQLMASVRVYRLRHTQITSTKPQPICTSYVALVPCLKSRGRNTISRAHQRSRGSHVRSRTLMLACQPL